MLERILRFVDEKQFNVARFVSGYLVAQDCTKTAIGGETKLPLFAYHSLSIRETDGDPFNAGFKFYGVSHPIKHAWMDMKYKKLQQE